jgi:hypothetical protein
MAPISIFGDRSQLFPIDVELADGTKTTVYTRKLTAGDRDRFTSAMLGEDPSSTKFGRIFCKVIQTCLRDKDGNRHFDDSEETFQQLYEETDVDLTEKLAEAVLKLNGMTKYGGVSDEELKKAAKNS